MSEQINSELNENVAIDEELDEDIVLDEELDEVNGGLGVAPGNRTFRPTTSLPVFNTFKMATRRVIGNVSPGFYLRNCKRSVVKNTGEIWISFGGISRTRTGLVTPLAGGVVGWVDGSKCVEG